MNLIARIRRVSLPLFLTAFVLSAAPVTAVTMDISAGFDGVSKSQFWTPVAVRLVNDSDKGIAGTITVQRVRYSSLPAQVCTAAVDLPPRSDKLYHTYIRLAGYNGEIRVSLMDGSKPVAVKTVEINTLSYEDKLVLSVGDRSSRLTFLEGEAVATVSRSLTPGNPFSSPVAVGAVNVQVHTAAISPKMLPDRPAAYEGVDVIVLSPLDPAAVSPDSMNALAMWVASGGTLVVSTGPDYRRFSNSFYSELLPVTVTGAENVAGTAAMRSLGSRPFPAGSAAVSRSTIKPGVGRRLAAVGDIPLVAERSYGVGKVVFLAYDIHSAPFRDWNGQTAFWKSVLAAPSTQPMAGSVTWSPEDFLQYGSYYRHNGFDPSTPGIGLLGVIAQNPSVKMPSFGTIGSFLIAYLVILVPVNYFFLRRRRRLEMAWVTTPLIVVAFTLGAYAIGYTMKGGDLKMREAVVIEASSGARFARTVANVSIFSPAKRVYDLRVADSSFLTQTVVLSEGRTPQPARIEGKETAVQLDMAMWSGESLEAVGGTDLGGALKSDLVLSGRRLSGVISNGTSLPLKNCRLIYGDAVVDVGDLAVGGSVNVDAALKASAPRAQLNEGSLGQNLAHYLKKRADTAWHPVLVGVVSPGSQVFDIPGRRPNVERVQMCVFHLDYTMGGSFRVPTGAVTYEMTDQMNVDTSYGFPEDNETGIVCNFGDVGKCALICTVPRPLGSRLTGLFLTASGATAGIDLGILNRNTGNWDSVAVGSGVSVASPGQYLNELNQVKIRVRSQTSGYRRVRVELSAEGVQAQ